MLLGSDSPQPASAAQEWLSTTCSGGTKFLRALFRNWEHFSSLVGIVWRVSWNAFFCSISPWFRRGFYRERKRQPVPHLMGWFCYLLTTRPYDSSSLEDHSEEVEREPVVVLETNNWTLLQQAYGEGVDWALRMNKERFHQRSERTMETITDWTTLNYTTNTSALISCVALSIDACSWNSSVFFFFFFVCAAVRGRITLGYARMAGHAVDRVSHEKGCCRSDFM